MYQMVWNRGETPPPQSILGTFPKDFSQVATSQDYFPKWQLPKCAISQAATSQVFPSPSVQPTFCSIRGARPRSDNAFGRVPNTPQSVLDKPDFSRNRVWQKINIVHVWHISTTFSVSVLFSFFVGNKACRRNSKSLLKQKNLLKLICPSFGTKFSYLTFMLNPKVFPQKQELV